MLREAVTWHLSKVLLLNICSKIDHDIGLSPQNFEPF